MLITASCEEDPARERELVQALLRRRVDALLLVPASDDHAYLAREAGENTPVVFLDRPPGGIEADTVLLDNRGGARSASSTCWPRATPDRLRRRPRPPVHRQRAPAGLPRRARGAGVPIDHDLVRLDTHSAGPAEAVVRELLALAPDRRPTAIFTGNNRHTVGALRALRGLEHEVALVGFDDFELADLLGDHRRPPRQPAARPRTPPTLAFVRLDGDERAAPPRRGPDRARDPRIRGGPAAVKPLVLPPNVQHHFYVGGRRIAALRGIELDDDHMPEEWIGAVNTMFGQPGARAQPARGRHASCATRSPPTPRRYLGPEHVARCGADAGAAGQAARRRRAPARCTSTRPRLRPRRARRAARQDRGLDHRRGRAGRRGPRRLRARTSTSTTVRALDATPRTPTRCSPRCTS